MRICLCKIILKTYITLHTYISVGVATLTLEKQVVGYLLICINIKMK